MILYDKIFIGVVLGGALVLYIVAEMARKYINSEWRALYCLPAIVGMFLLAVEGFEVSMLGAYIGVVFLLAGMIKDDVRVRRIACLVAMVLGLITIPICLCNEEYRAEYYEQQESIENYQE